MPQHNKFCSLPWLDVNLSPTAHYSLCCEADQALHQGPDRTPATLPMQSHWNGEFMKSIRRQLVAGNTPKICSACTVKEGSGLTSRRHIINQRYLGEHAPDINHPQVRALLAQTQADGHSLAPLQGADISLGNTCQLRCIHCSPSYSRSITKDYQKLGLDFNDKNRMPIRAEDRIEKQDPLVDQVLEELKKSIHSLRYIKFIGGEPSLTRPLMEFLRWCVEHGHNHRLTLLLVTNAVTVRDEFIDLLKQFHCVLLGISVDGVGQLDEWLRFPTNWERKTSNIQRLMENFPRAWIETTLFSLNIHQLPKIINWCREKNYRQHIHHLHWPESMCIRHLPQAVKVSLAEELEQFAQQLPPDLPDDSMLTDCEYRSFLRGTMDFMLSKDQDPLQWEQCLRTVSSYNTIRPRTLAEVNDFFSNFPS
jgi:pyruvate-formate lyase-activating enzyme